MNEVQKKRHNFAVLNPRGFIPNIELVPLAPRKANLDKEVIYIINSWGAGSGLDNILANVADFFQGRFENPEVISLHKPSPYMNDDPDLWDEMAKKESSFIYGAAPSCSTTAWAVTWAAGLEKRGLPGVVIIYNTFTDDAKLSCERVGTGVRWVAVPYPPQSITEKQLSCSMYQIVEALTKPLTLEEQKIGTWKPRKPPKVAVKGTFEEIQEHFYSQGWTDGLPIIPPTGERVVKMLSGTSHPPQEVVTTTMWPEEWQVTVEKVAINGVMAGCKPEYMPVLLAAVEAFSKADNSSRVRSTNSFSFMQVINGPIREEIGMNSGINALGPGNHANATIGRALRLFIVNLGGGQIGVNLMSNQGNTSAYTFCFAENEEASPWDSFAQEQGYKKQDSIMTVFGGGWCHLGNYLANPFKEFARNISVFEWPNGIVVLLSPPRAKLLLEKGYGKRDVKEYLWRNATSTMKAFRSNVYYKIFVEPILKGKEYYGEKHLWPKEYLKLPDEAIVPIYPRKHVYVIVVGGEANPMMQGWHMSNPSSASIDKWR